MFSCHLLVHNIIIFKDPYSTSLIHPCSYTAAISDVSPLDSEVIELPVADEDSGKDGSLSCSVTEGNVQQYFAVHLTQSPSTMATIVVNVSPIQPGSHILTVTCEDGGNPPKADTATVDVTVQATTNIKCDAAGLGM